MTLRVEQLQEANSWTNRTQQMVQPPVLLLQLSIVTSCDMISHVKNIEVQVVPIVHS